MELNEVVSVVVLVDPARSVLRTHATRLTLRGENKEIVNKLRKLMTTYIKIVMIP
jgi:hypothetical protein